MKEATLDICLVFQEDDSNNGRTSAVNDCKCKFLLVGELGRLITYLTSCILEVTKIKKIYLFFIVLTIMHHYNCVIYYHHMQNL